MYEAGHDARALVEKIRIEASSAQLRDARRQFAARRLDLGKSVLGIGDPLVQLHPCQRSSIALEGVAREVENQQCTQRGTDEVSGAPAKFGD